MMVFEFGHMVHSSSGIVGVYYIIYFFFEIQLSLLIHDSAVVATLFVIQKKYIYFINLYVQAMVMPFDWAKILLQIILVSWDHVHFVFAYKYIVGDGDGDGDVDAFVVCFN